jgi:MFS family permease
MDNSTERKPWQTPTNEEQKKFPVRTCIGIVLGYFLWVGPYLGLVGVTVPKLVQDIDPATKQNVIATMSAVAMIVATISNIIWGGLSDRTRSRWGRRTPWIIVGSIGSFISIIAWSHAKTAFGVVVGDSVYVLFQNMIVAPLVAVIADRTSEQFRGTMSGMYALGTAAAQGLGPVIGSHFLYNNTMGFYVMATMTLVSGPIAALILHEQSTKDMPVEKIDGWKAFSANFVFPTHNARNFYLALFGKFMIIISQFAISGYTLYIFTDYIKLKGGAIQQYVSLISIILMITAIIMSLISGPLADKMKVRKLPVITAGLIIALGVFVPRLTTNTWGMLAYAVIAGIGFGMYNSVDQALNIDVLPNEKTAAKDLGLLNMANSAGQIFGPIVAATAINMGGYGYIFPAACVSAVLGSVLIFFIKGIK